MYTVPLWMGGTAQTDIAPPVLTARGGNFVRREGEKNRPTGSRKKSDYRSPGELIESKTK
jgi:hypothetical protein